MAQFPELVDTRRGLVLQVHVQPGAGRDRVVGRHGDACKISVSAPPAGGKANVAVVRLVAAVFGVRRSDVEVVAGHTSRHKRVSIAGITLVDAAEALDRAYGSGTATTS